jgi:TctA family transporter
MAFFRGTGGAGTATFEQLPLAISEGGTSATTVASARVALLPSYSGNATFVLAVNATEDDIEFVTAQSTISYSDATANFTGILQESGSNVLTSADIGVSVASAGVTGGGVSYSDATANFTGVLQHSASNVLTQSMIGVSVQGYDADIAFLDAATANFTGVLQDGGSTVLTESSTIEGGTYS